jgi:bifunctional non-homologous end joining protein LigD
LGSTEVWLDGEIVALVDGRPTFYALQHRIHAEGDRAIKRAAADTPITYLIFDVLHLNGESCLDLPYGERRTLLEGLELAGPNWHTSPSYPGEGAAVADAAREQRLEGVIAKRLGSRYFPGRRSPDWIKIAETRPVEVVVGGWRPGEGRREDSLGSLMIGVPTADGLRYVGQVGTGFTDEVLQSLITKLRGMTRKTSPFVNEVPRDRARGAHWVEPALVGEVEFLNWTSDGRLRAPRWRGLRTDKSPQDVLPMELPDGG